MRSLQLGILVVVGAVLPLFVCECAAYLVASVAHQNRLSVALMDERDRGSSSGVGAPELVDKSLAYRYMVDHGRLTTAKDIDVTAELREKESNNAVYRVRIRTDRFGDRITSHPSATGDRDKRSVNLLLGCSYTFGEGLQDSETLAHRLEERLPESHFTTMAVPGYGPGDNYADLTERAFWADKVGVPGKMIYVWTDYQMGRFLGSLDVVGRWGDRLLRVSEGAPYDFHVDGTFQEVTPLRTKALKVLSRSHFLRFFEIDFPLPSDSDFARLARLFKSMENVYRENTRKGNHMYLVIFPGQKRYAAKLREYVGREGIRVLDFSHVSPFELSAEGPYFKYDNHPIAKVIENWANLLAQALQDGQETTVSTRSIQHLSLQQRD